MARKIKKVPSKAEYDFGGKRRFTIQGIDLTTGISYTAKAIDDEDRKLIIVKCRRCGKVQEWDKNTTTEDEWFSGLCEDCIQKENRKTIKAIAQVRMLRDSETGEFRPPESHEEWQVFYGDGTEKILSNEALKEEFCWKDKELEELFSKLKIPMGEDWKLIRYNESHMNDPQIEVSLESEDSIFRQIIRNREIEEKLESFKKYENWKKENFDIFLELWARKVESVRSLLKFLQKNFPNSKSPSGSNWSIKGLRELCAYLNLIPKDSSREWQKWEFAIRDEFGRKGILIPERLIIFKDVRKKTFSYKELDSLGKINGEFYLFEAKYKGGPVDPEQLELYRNALEKMGYKIKACFFITADDTFFGKLTDKIYRINEVTLKGCLKGNKDEMSFRFKRAAEICEKSRA